MADFEVINHGTLFSLIPRTLEAKDWVEDHLSEDRTEFGDTIAVEHRYIEAIVQGIIHDGLTIE